MKYALRRDIGRNRCILWELDADYNYIGVVRGYINHRNRTVAVYKDHKKVDCVAEVLLVPLLKVGGLSDSQIAALIKDGKIKAEA